MQGTERVERWRGGWNNDGLTGTARHMIIRKGIRNVSWGRNARLRATAIGLPVAVKLFVGHVAVTGSGSGGSGGGGRRHDLCWVLDVRIRDSRREKSEKAKRRKRMDGEEGVVKG